MLLLGAANQPLCEPVMVSTGVEGFAVVSARRVYKEIKGDCPPPPCRYLIATLVLNGGDMDKFPSCFALALDLLKRNGVLHSGIAIGDASDVSRRRSALSSAKVVSPIAARRMEFTLCQSRL